MVTLEQVERLRERADVNLEDAKTALEATDGDLLDALIYLEKQGKVTPPAGGGYYSSQSNTTGDEKKGKKEKHHGGENFSDMMHRFGRFCAGALEKGNNNYLEAERQGSVVFSLPVTVVVVLLIFFFWVTVPLFILSLFFGFRYCFRGEELGKESVNKVMDDASNTVEELKRSMNRENKE